jgi:hypothetical protein
MLKVIKRGLLFSGSVGSTTQITKQPGYTQALEHIRLVHEGYELFTFNMVSLNIQITLKSQ